MKRQITWREALYAGAGGAVLAVVMTWPLVLHLGSDIGKDLGDPLLQAWQVAWIGHALLHAPLHLWQANTFWPYDDTLAFSDALIGYAPVGLLSQSSPHAALVGYNLLFLFAYALAFLGAYLLARELGVGPIGGAVGGAAFAYAPWKLTQNGHLHVLSSGGVPLALFLLVRGYRRKDPRFVFAGWGVAGWQLTLGFTNGLQLGYLLGVLGIGTAVVWIRRPGLRPRRGLLGATLLGLAVFAIAGIFMARPYLRVVDAHPEARKSVETVADFSPVRRSFLAAPSQSRLWGDLTDRVRAPLNAPEEESLFPGLAIALLAIIGVFAGTYPFRLRIGLTAGVVVCAALSMGVRDVDGPGAYLTPYRFLYELAPGWDGVRTPGRINMLTSLGLALLAAAGICAVVRRVQSRWQAAVGAAAIGAILLEGLGPLTHPRVPTPPAAMAVATDPQLHLPAGFSNDLRYSYWSTAGFPLIVNGAGGFDPTGYDRLRHEVAGFPDEASIALLERFGVRSVVLHPAYAVGTVWEQAVSKPIAGLPVEREQVGDAVVFRLR
jgi:hypothetical protein